MLSGDVREPTPVSLPRPPRVGLVQHPSVILDNCAIICSYRYIVAEQKFTPTAGIAAILALRASVGAHFVGGAMKRSASGGST
jgi:hypothetical protein